MKSAEYYENQCENFTRELTAILSDLDGVVERIGEFQTRLLIDSLLEQQQTLAGLAQAAATLQARKTPVYRTTNEQRFGSA